jgi:hypothetical protein
MHPLQLPSELASAIGLRIELPEVVVKETRPGRIIL